MATKDMAGQKFSFAQTKLIASRNKTKRKKQILSKSVAHFWILHNDVYTEEVFSKCN